MEQNRRSIAVTDALHEGKNTLNDAQDSVVYAAGKAQGADARAVNDIHKTATTAVSQTSAVVSDAVEKTRKMIPNVSVTVG